MPTEPNDLLNREASLTRIAPLVQIANPVLREVINHGTQVWDICQRQADGEPDEHLPVFLLYMHVLDMADGIEILLSNSSVYPTKPLLRSMFEAYMGIDYILEKDSKRRSFAWLAAQSRAKLRAYTAMSSTTQAGRALRKEMEQDDVATAVNLPDDVTRPAIENIEALLKQENYKDALRELKRVEKKKSKSEWYSAYGGPNNLRELAKRLHHLSSYEWLYRHWSTIVHATDTGPRLTKGRSGPAIYSLRHPDEFMIVANMAVYIVIAATQTLVKKFAPEYDFRGWYVAEARTGWERIRNAKVNFRSPEQ